MVNARLLETTITNQFINVYFSSFQLYNWFAVLYKHTLRSIQTNAITLIFFGGLVHNQFFPKGNDYREQFNPNDQMCNLTTIIRSKH